MAEKVGQIGAVLILSSIFVGLVTNIDVLSDAEILPWKNLAAVTLVAPLGMTFAPPRPGHRPVSRRAYGLQPMATIVIETGVQNSVLAMAIVSLSYSGSLANSQAFPARSSHHVGHYGEL